MDNRATAPVVGKVLAAGLAVLYIAATTSLLLGGVVPEYRTAAGDELAGRVLATAADRVERAVPDTDEHVDVEVRVDLPDTIRDAGYRLVLQNGTLRLDHPEDALDTRIRLSLPSKVRTKRSARESDLPVVIHVTGPASNRTVVLRGASR